MILVCASEKEGGLQNELRDLLGESSPLVFQGNRSNIRPLLPYAQTVIIHHVTKPWKSEMGFPDHDNVIAVVPTDSVSNYPFDLLRNLKQAQVRDTFILADEEDRDRLKKRLETLVIQEKKEATDAHED